MLTINGEMYCMLTQKVSAISNRLIGQKVTSLLAGRSEMLAALDFKMTGV